VYRTIELGQLVRIDREEAVRRILEAHMRTRGNTTRAAEELGVSRRHLVRLLAELNLAGAVSRMRRDESGTRPAIGFLGLSAEKKQHG